MGGAHYFEGIVCEGGVRGRRWVAEVRSFLSVRNDLPEMRGPNSSRGLVMSVRLGSHAAAVASRQSHLCRERGPSFGVFQPAHLDFFRSRSRGHNDVLRIFEEMVKIGLRALWPFVKGCSLGT